MRRELIGQNPDGSPHYHYIAEDGEVAVVTGPAVAVLTMADGTAYDVSEPVVGVAVEHHDELVDALGEHYAAGGHRAHDAASPFVHVPLAESRAANDSKED